MSKNVFEEADTQVKICNAAEAVVSSLIVMSDQRKATKFLGPNLVVKLTSQRKYSKRERQRTFLLTIGKPNYAERKFVKECKKAGEPFPVEKVQLKAHPVPRKLKTKSKVKKAA
jgi:hypothetical protein